MNKETFEYIKNFILIEDLNNMSKDFFIKNELDYNLRKKYCIKWKLNENGAIDLLIINYKEDILIDTLKVKQTLIKLKKIYIKRSFYNLITPIDIKIKTQNIKIVSLIQDIFKIEKNNYNFYFLGLDFKDSCSINTNSFKMNENITIFKAKYLNGLKIKTGQTSLDSYDSINKMREISKKIEEMAGKTLNYITDEDCRIIEMMCI